MFQYHFYLAKTLNLRESSPNSKNQMDKKSIIRMSSSRGKINITTTMGGGGTYLVNICKDPKWVTCKEYTMTEVVEVFFRKYFGRDEFSVYFKSLGKHKMVEGHAWVMPRGVFLWHWSTFKNSPMGPQAPGTSYS